MRRAPCLLPTLLIALLALATPALAEAPAAEALAVADFLDLEDVGEPRISPDGKSILFTREWVNKLEDRWQSEIWISFAGTTDITEWGYHRFDGYPWENPKAWLDHSPLMHVGFMRTQLYLMSWFGDHAKE